MTPSTRRPALLSTLLLALAAPGAAQWLPVVEPQTVGLSSDRLARIEHYLQRQVDDGNLAGAVVLVARHGHVAYVTAVGMADREARRPMSMDAIFRIASQSKAVTSVAIMMLVEEGAIALSDPVSRFIPAYAHTTVAVPGDTGLAIVPARRAITIRDLLTHTAGISYGTEEFVAERYRAAGLGPAAGYGWYFADKAEPICTSMERLAALPFVAQPGERWVYGYNTDILGCVVERASGMPFDRFLATRIFDPLDMRDTRFFLPAEQRRRLTAVYAAQPGGGIARAAEGARGQGTYVDGPRASFSGGAGLLSTAGDYGRFLQMLLNGGQLEGARLLGPMTVRLMTVNQSDTLYDGPDHGFGLGFEILERDGGDGTIGSAGAFSWGGAYHSSYFVDPEQELVAVLLTQHLPAAVNVTGRFKTLVYQAVIEAAGAR
jgi:CubicO group peptidase (beta-lactamase class C family)